MIQNLKQLLGIALAVLVLHAPAFAQAPGGRIVTIDLNRLFTEYYKTPAASQKLKDTADQYNREYEELRTQFRKLAAALSEEQATIEDVYEPYLLKLGLIERTPRGRTVTERARKHYL